ncbi:hypothetical protein SprV_0100261400 [Sparganum proliferum]
MLATCIPSGSSSASTGREPGRAEQRRPQSSPKQPDAAIDQLHQVKTNAGLVFPPSLHEAIRAVQQLSNGKAPGSDAIPAEIYMHVSPQFVDHLTALFHGYVARGTSPSEFQRRHNRLPPQTERKPPIMRQPQRHRHAQHLQKKIFARILLNRLSSHLEQRHLPKSKCSFRRYHGTIDMIFAFRQLQMKCQEMRIHLYPTFVDLTKALDTVNLEGL